MGSARCLGKLFLWGWFFMWVLLTVEFPRSVILYWKKLVPVRCILIGRKFPDKGIVLAIILSAWCRAGLGCLYGVLRLFLSSFEVCWYVLVLKSLMFSLRFIISGICVESPRTLMSNLRKDLLIYRQVNNKVKEMSYERLGRAEYLGG